MKHDGVNEILLLRKPSINNQTILMNWNKTFLTLLCAGVLTISHAQTEHDAIMMNKKQWCNGFGYMHSAWNDYWEGTFKRDNDNIGSVTTQSFIYMTNYGLTNKLNIMASLPYVTTKASAGTLHGMKGLQDVSVYLKWKPVTLKYGSNKVSLLTVGGVSTPTSNYVIDFLPLSIGLGSTNITGRGIIDYQRGKLFTTLTGSYQWRSNVTLDRTSYYSTEIHYTNEVKMPNVAMYSVSAGLRSKYLIAEVMLNRMITLGGFDIRKNDMPFPSNKMNSTMIGGHVKYTLPFYTHLELTGDVNRVVAGRNVGQANTFGVGAYYIFGFK